MYIFILYIDISFYVIRMHIDQFIILGRDDSVNFALLSNAHVNFIVYYPYITLTTHICCDHMFEPVSVYIQIRIQSRTSSFAESVPERTL